MRHSIGGAVVIALVLAIACLFIFGEVSSAYTFPAADLVTPPKT
jgi:hypothetical protein